MKTAEIFQVEGFEFHYFLDYGKKLWTISDEGVEPVNALLWEPADLSKFTQQIYNQFYIFSHSDYSIENYFPFYVFKQTTGLTGGPRLEIYGSNYPGFYENETLALLTSLDENEIDEMEILGAAVAENFEAFVVNYLLTKKHFCIPFDCKIETIID